MTLYEIKTNTKYNSLEIYFTDKPDEATREALKAKKFRWNPKKSCWYGFGNEEDIKATIDGNHTAIIPEASFVDGGGLYDGWEGGNNKKWSNDDQLKAYLKEDFKKAGIKATIKSRRSGYLTALVFTMTIKADEIKSYEEYKEVFDLGKCCGFHWYYYTDEEGKIRDIHHDKLFDYQGKEFEEMKENICRTSYEMTKERLTSYGCSHSDYDYILRENAAKRFEVLQKIVSSYNRDCTNSMVDYFDRDIYDDYCFKIA